MQNKQISQSEALKNLVKKIPVKERQNISQTRHPSYRSQTKETISCYLHHARLDLEISLYGVLSRYSQFRRRLLQKSSSELHGKWT